jgi:S1-C subfamily serine protease
MDLLRQTPIGKRVEVIYIRDGNFHNTQLTTISEDDYNQLNDAFNARPEGKGVFGFDTDKTTRVTVPETKTYGVRLNYVEPNSPADLFGIKAGDIITDFDNVPIRTTAELLSRVRRAIPKTPITVVVLRDGQRMEIPIKLGKQR